MPPTFKLAKTLWGVENVEPENFDTLFAKIKTEGFEAVEAMHAKFLRETGQSHEQAPLVTVDPRNWAAPFT